ncbi:MAG TPA: hypothetical protein VLF63_01185, partial [Patescibacteria group bacterium]|nr:hypothetical protein [Patescibacteria group bacterium]
MTAGLAIGIVAIVGSVILFKSHATTPFVSLNADNGVLTAPAVKQTCTGTNDGNCVIFGGATSTMKHYEYVLTDG